MKPRAPARESSPAGAAGYSGTPLWKKLGYRAGLSACVVDAPTGYRTWLQLPADQPVKWLPRPTMGAMLIHRFCTDAKSLKQALVEDRARLDPTGAVWVSWPKKSSKVPTDVTEDVIRSLALPMGFVDIKVCAVDATWSGLKLVIRRGER